MILVVVVDQLTKYIVQARLPLYGAIEVIPGFFSLTYVHNTGAAWSILSGQQLFLILVSLVEMAVLAWFLIKYMKEKNTIYCVALSLMLGGAIGNLIDRVTLHYVRDFLDFIIFGYDFPVFNVADSALCIGVGILFLAMILEEKKHA